MSLPLGPLVRPHGERTPTEEGGSTAAARSTHHSDVARRAFAVTNPVSAQLTSTDVTEAPTVPDLTPIIPAVYIYNDACICTLIHTFMYVQRFAWSTQLVLALTLFAPIPFRG